MRGDRGYGLTTSEEALKLRNLDLRVLDALGLRLGKSAVLVGTHARESSDSIYAEGRCDDGAVTLAWGIIGMATSGDIFQRSDHQYRDPVGSVQTVLFDADESDDHGGYACPEVSRLYSVVDDNLTIVSGELRPSVAGAARFIKNERAQLVVLHRPGGDDLDAWCDRLQSLAQAATVAVLGVLPVDPEQLTQLVEAGERPLGVGPAMPLLIAHPVDPIDDDIEMLDEVGWCAARGELLICEKSWTKPRRLAAYTVDEDGIWWAPTTDRPGHDRPVSDAGN